MSRNLLALCLALGLLAPVARAGVPHALTYSGYLEEAGQPVTGRVMALFEIYDAADGGTALWSQTSGSVSVSAGHFSVALVDSATVDLDAAFFSGRTLWLQVNVNGDILSPRTALDSVPYAARSEVTDLADRALMCDDSSHLGGTPAGDYVTSSQLNSALASYPTAASLLLDGGPKVSWVNLSSVPAGFSDGVDNVGLTAETDPNVKSWAKNNCTCPATNLGMMCNFPAGTCWTTASCSSQVWLCTPGGWFAGNQPYSPG